MLILGALRDNLKVWVMKLYVIRIVGVPVYITKTPCKTGTLALTEKGEPLTGELVISLDTYSEISLINADSWSNLH